jgi:hypothetical protein
MADGGLQIENFKKSAICNLRSALKIQYFGFVYSPNSATFAGRLKYLKLF